MTIAAVACSKISPLEFVRDYTRARCAVVAKCTGQADYLRDFCVAAGEGAIAAKDAARAIAASRATYDERRAADCLNALADLKSCDDTALADKACAAALHGNGAPQDTCYSDWDCESGGCDVNYALGPVCVVSKCLSPDAVVVSRGGLLLGSCSYFTTGAGLNCEDPSLGYSSTGGSCSFSIACPSGERCQNGRCAPVAIGDSCPGGAVTNIPPPCGLGSGMYCRRPASASAGTCQQRLARGAQCNVRDAQWLAGQAGVELYSDGNPCGVGSICVGGGSDASGQPLTGTCGPASDERGPCVSPTPVGALIFTGCKNGLACQDGRCVIPPPSGPCLQGLCAADAFCDFSMQPPTCVAKLADGAACTCPGDRCASGVCLGANCTDPQTPAEFHGVCNDGRCHEPP